MQTLKTISGRILKVTVNNQLRHFTIKTESAKFRSFKMTKDEFNSAYYWTGNDWQNFLTSDDYFKVK